MATKVIVRKFKFVISKLWEFARLVTAMTCVNLVFPLQKVNSNETLQRDTRILFGFFSLNSFSFYCTINGTNVQIERTWKDTESVLVVELKTSLALSLRTTCLREFRYQVDESSSINQIPHVLTFWVLFVKD